MSNLQVTYYYLSDSTKGPSPVTFEYPRPPKFLARLCTIEGKQVLSKPIRLEFTGTPAPGTVPLRVKKWMKLCDDLLTQKAEEEISKSKPPTPPPNQHAIEYLKKLYEQFKTKEDFGD